MVKSLKVVVLAGALAFVAAPAFAQDLGLPGLDQLGAGINGLTSGIDLDPLHIMSPAPAAAPAAAPAPMKKHHHKHMMMHHKKMMKKAK